VLPKQIVNTPASSERRKSVPKKRAREIFSIGGVVESCGEGGAQIWKSRARKCLTVSKNRGDNEIVVRGCT
jgi:hypothetical protein